MPGGTSTLKPSPSFAESLRLTGKITERKHGARFAAPRGASIPALGQLQVACDTPPVEVEPAGSEDGIVMAQSRRLHIKHEGPGCIARLRPLFGQAIQRLIVKCDGGVHGAEQVLPKRD